MRALTPIVRALLASALTALVVVGLGGARPAESVSCSSALPPGRVDLTDDWTAPPSPYVYKVLQKGSCVWWAGGKSRANVFFGSVFGSAVTGVWADAATQASGTITFSLSSSGNVLLRRSSTGNSFPAKYLKRSR